MVSTRSQKNNALFSAPLSVVKRLSAPLASISETTTTAATATADASDTDTKKMKKAKRAPAYKSIVQTRSQKLREAMEAYDSMLNKVGTFYMKHLREPEMTATDPDELAMATFLHNLRTQPLNAEVVQKALTRMPWFQWDKSKYSWKPPSLTLTLLSGLFVLTMSVGLSVMVQMSLHDTSDMHRLIGWMKPEHFE
jgi:hypothetical protein